MFLSHIAISLELVSLALGALLILKSCRSYGSHCHTVDTAHGGHRETAPKKNTSTDHPNELPKKGHGHHGFLKFIGYFVIILSFLGFLCTSISYVCYLTKYGYMEEVYPGYKSRNLDQRQDVVPRDNTMVPPAERPQTP